MKSFLLTRAPATFKFLVIVPLAADTEPDAVTLARVVAPETPRVAVETSPDAVTLARDAAPETPRVFTDKTLDTVRLEVDIGCVVIT